jgi:hypothetical protein
MGGEGMGSLGRFLIDEKQKNGCLREMFGFYSY